MKLKNVALNLLDLSKNNRLINYKENKYATVKVCLPNVDTLYSDLFMDKTYEVYNIDKFISVVSKETPLSEIEFDDVYPHIEKNIKSKHIVLFKQNGYVNQIIKNLKKKALESLLEKGINILYLTLGMLVYKNANEEAMAPILLVPVKIENINASTFNISLYDEEIILNPTLAYKLKNENNIVLNPFKDDMLPTEYFSYVNDKCMEYGWYTIPECHIGLFSFNKLNMYEDLIENEEYILKNPLVTNLLNQKNKNELELNEYGNDIYTVVDADHTQLNAIKAIRRGESIVLEGPPGTGKSQTITNIISSALYDGKKVLFVSEKQAALNVVYEKLKKANLDEFSLALHSTKTNKKEVINELYNTLFSPKTNVSDEAYDVLDEIGNIETFLNDYADTMHTSIDEYKLSLYEIISNASYYRNNCSYEIPHEALSKAYYDKTIKNLEDYILYKDIIDYDYRKFPFYGFKDLAINHSKKNINVLEDTKEFLTGILKNINNIKNIYNIDITNIIEYRLFYDLLLVLEKTTFYNKELFKIKDYDFYINLVSELNNLATTYNKNKKVADTYFNSDVYSESFIGLLPKLKSYNGKLFKGFNKEYKEIIKKIEKISKKHIRYNDIIVGLEAAKIVYEIDFDFELKAYEVSKIIKEKYDGYNTKFSDLEHTLLALKKASIIKDFNNIEYEYDKELIEAIKKSLINYDSFMETSKLYDEEIIKLDSYNIKDLFTKTVGKINNYDYLKTWIEIKKILDDLKNINSLRFLDYALDNKIPLDEISNIFKGVYYKSLATILISENKCLNSFNSIDVNKNIDLYIKGDHKSFDIAKAMIRSKLQSMKPNCDVIAPGSSAALISREYQKKRKQMSVRELLNSNPEFIQTLKPCFLMSPLSVSTYLEAGRISFDLVIFDEASQIFPYDAFGAIYRSKQMVVVGDSKQMPPSNFFGTIENEDDSDEESVGDYESILDIASACLPKYRLMWHYRSKNEELIAFSNENFYDNTLVTFPSAKKHSLDFGIDLCYTPNGVFNHTKRNNEVEAKKVCELVRDHYKKYGNKRSLGIIAFSLAQQSLIESMVNKMIVDEKIDVSNPNEPLFIKNLETVQGDERDTIIFSVGYGYDEKRKFIQSFGPLNRDGGERRLNVAVSRAKYNVKLVTSIKPSDITSKSRGPSLLREYIAFSENRNIISDSNNDAKADFVLEVKSFLEENGYNVEYRVGYSMMKIDLCIVDPITNDYVAAIECDGDMYYSGELCRDRNRLRKEILEVMGFNFIRVWSIGWYQNKTLEQKLLLEALSNTNKKQEKEELEIVHINEDKTFNEYVFSCDEELINSYKEESDFSNVVIPIIELEAPINEDWLLSRICPIYGIEKPNRDTVSRYELDKALYLPPNIISKNGYLYIDGKDIELRIPSVGQKPRDIKYISPVEIAYGMKKYLINNENILLSDLYKSFIKLMGYKRTSDAIIRKLEEALEVLKEIAVVIIRDDRIKVVNI